MVAHRPLFAVCVVAFSLCVVTALAADEAEPAAQGQSNSKTAAPVESATVPTKPPEEASLPLILRIDKAALFRYIDGEPTERRPIDQYVLGAHAVGESHTQGAVRGELLPDIEEAAFVIRFRGNTKTKTRGTQGPAVVYSSTHTEFVCTRRVEFDPRQGFQAVGETEIEADTRLRYDGYASTRSLGRRVITFFAQRGAQKVREQARLIADRDNKRQVVEGFEKEVDEQIQAANQGLDVVRYVNRFLGENTSLQLFAKSSPEAIQLGVGTAGEKYAPMVALPEKRVTERRPVEVWLHASILSKPVGLIVETLTPDVAIPAEVQSKILGALDLVSDDPKKVYDVALQDGWLVLGLPQDEGKASPKNNPTVAADGSTQAVRQASVEPASPTAAAGPAAKAQ